jgi:hypothetical protein
MKSLCKYIGIVCLLILSTTLVSASYYNYDIDVQFPESTINEDVGDIVITKTTIVPEIVTTVTFTTQQLEQQDRFVWDGTGAVDIQNTQGVLATLQSGQSYTFTQTGTYSYSQNGTQAKIIVSPVPQLQGKLLLQSDIEFSYDDVQYQIDTARVFPITIEYIASKKGVYPIQVNFSYPQNKKQVTKELTIGSIQTWNITDSTVNTTTAVKAGDFKSIGTIEVTNTGNDNYPISVSITGDINNFLSVENEIQLYRGTETYVNIVAQIPSQQEDKTVSGKIILENAQQRKEVNLTIDIKDLIKPTIQNITFEHDTLVKPNTIIVRAIDNVDVQKVTGVLSVFNITANQTITQNITFTKDQQLFTGTHAFTIPNIYRMTFCAIDIANNSVCQDTNKSFFPINTVERENRVDGKTVKTDKWNRIKILSASDEIYNGLHLQLTRLSDDTGDVNISAYSLRIVDKNEQTTQITSFNDTIPIIDGVTYLEVRGDTIGQWEAQFSLISEYFVAEYQPFIVTGKIGTYETPEKKTVTILGREVTFEPFDTGVQEDSYFEVKTRLPITTDIDNGIVISTVEEQQLQDEKMSEKNTTIGLLHFRYISTIAILVALLSTSGLGFWYIHFEKPNVIRIKPRK